LVRGAPDARLIVVDTLQKIRGPVSAQGQQRMRRDYEAVSGSRP
jgi:hypothetical protein